jgi:hypothetical protein
MERNFSVNIKYNINTEGCQIPEQLRRYLIGKPLTKRSQGRPKYGWEDNIKQDICQLKIENWIACIQDGGKWKEVVEKAKTFN